MSWNGSRGNSVKNAQCPQSNGVAWKRIVFCGIVVVISVIATLLFISDTFELSKKPDEVSKSKRIADVSAKAKTIPEVEPEKKQKLEKVVDHPHTNKWGNPWHWGPNKKLKPRHISRFDNSKLPLYERIFKNSADRTIAGLLVIEPGDSLIGGDEPSPWFLKSFLRSLETPVLPTKNDTEEEAALKRAVLETKVELKARLDSGEDIVKLLTETRRELRELGAYREDLEKIVDEFRRKKAVTKEDLEDAVGAANKMLEERGLKKIAMPEFYYKQLEMRAKIRSERAKNVQ